MILRFWLKSSKDCRIIIRKQHIGMEYVYKETYLGFGI